MSKPTKVEPFKAGNDKAAVRRLNAQNAFNELILELKPKGRWTPAARMRYNRVAAFLGKP